MEVAAAVVHYDSKITLIFSSEETNKNPRAAALSEVKLLEQDYHKKWIIVDGMVHHAFLPELRYSILELLGMLTADSSQQQAL